MSLITPELLRSATGCTQDAADLYAQHLSDACTHYGINTLQRLAAFLAQIGHESGSLRYAREIASGEAYEGRKSLGNTEPGDGPRYRGRGLIQITGRDGYRRAAARMQPLGAPDFEQYPTELESPRWAAWSACDWWAAYGCNALADAGEYVKIGRQINRGNANTPTPANGEDDRLARWERAKTALQITAPAPAPAPDPEANQWRSRMPPFVLAALPAIIEAIPKLGKLFGSGSQVAERNLKAVELAVGAVKESLNVATEQEAVQRLQTDPAAVQTATRAIDAIWYELTEAGGGGIEGARKADAVQRAAGDLLHSASFWIACALLPLVYLIVLSLIGMVGTATWSDDVRAGLAGSLISAIIGGLVGYYYGTTTSRNRTPAP